MHTTELPRRLLRATEVLQMLEDGTLQAGEPVELIEGELLVVDPQGQRHASHVTALKQALAAHYAAVGVVRSQLPLSVESFSLPEPDLCVVRGAPEDYVARRPVATDALLVIECSHSSHALDQRKIRVYARSSVQTYWIVDLVARHVEVRTDPNPGASGYRSNVTLGPDDVIELPGLGKSIPVTEVLG